MPRSAVRRSGNEEKGTLGEPREITWHEGELALIHQAAVRLHDRPRRHSFLGPTDVPLLGDRQVDLDQALGFDHRGGSGILLRNAGRRLR
jgi:hypothetical protein